MVNQKASERRPLRENGIKRLLCIAPRGPTALRQLLVQFPGWDVCTVSTIKDADQVLQHQLFLVGLLLDCVGHFGQLELNSLLNRHWQTQWVGVLERKSLESPSCRRFVTDHLCDFHTYPVDALLLKHTLGHAHGWAAIRERSAPQANHSGSCKLSGDGPAIKLLRRQISRVARVSAPVLIWGESGSGKELVAQSIHEQSSCATGPFVAINCGAMPANLIQSELFGHERGAFTGATRGKLGLIELAQNGTIFLDEIADLPLELQANLLRFLQEKTIYRVGGTTSLQVNARIIAASHINLQDAVQRGVFRQDLFYRMSVLPIEVPPLRERKEDLPLLVDEFFRTFSSEKNPQLKGISSSAMHAITSYAWPGNVRELMNRIRRAMVLAEGRLVSVEDLGLGSSSVVRGAEELDESRGGAEKLAIIASLDRVGRNISQAARNLGISRMTLYRLIEKHGIGKRV
jgi:DNA-binding NtrC family response regulator